MVIVLSLSMQVIKLVLPNHATVCSSSFCTVRSSINEVCSNSFVNVFHVTSSSVKQSFSEVYSNSFASFSKLCSNSCVKSSLSLVCSDNSVSSFRDVYGNISKVFLVRSTCTLKHLSEVAPVKSEGLVWLTVWSWRSAAVLSEASSVRLIMKVLSGAVSDKSVLTVLSGAVTIRSVETVTCLLTSVAVSTKSVVRVL